MTRGTRHRFAGAAALAGLTLTMLPSVAAAATDAAECEPDPEYDHCRVFDYLAVGEVDTFTVPASTTTVRALVWGAGGGGMVASLGSGGGGAHVAGTLPVAPGDVLEIKVGQAGEPGGYESRGAGGDGAAANGGHGGQGRPTWIGGGGGGGGSTVTHHRLGELLIAGGGGGTGLMHGGVGGAQPATDDAQGRTGADGIGGAGAAAAAARSEPVVDGQDGGARSGGEGGSLYMGGGGGGGGFGGGGGGSPFAPRNNPIASGGGGGGGNLVASSVTDGESEAADASTPGNPGSRFLDDRSARGGGTSTTGDAQLVQAGDGRVVLMWNEDAPGVADVIAPVSGSGQIAEAGAYFANPLTARVQDAAQVGVPNLPVTFTIQGSTGTRFAASSDQAVTVAADGTQATVMTSADPASTGVARTPALIAGPASGTVAVQAAADGVSTPAAFTLQVVPGAATRLSIVAGDGQTADPFTTFGQNLRVAVTNSAGTPTQGVHVTYAIQGGTSTTFQNGALTAESITDETGIAGSPPVLAGFSGSVTVIAWLSDGSAQVAFHLTAAGDVRHGLNPHTGEIR